MMVQCTKIPVSLFDEKKAGVRSQLCFRTQFIFFAVVGAWCWGGSVFFLISSILIFALPDSDTKKETCLMSIQN